MLGVYLPTIQHILGVTMFIRLFWVVGMAGIAQTFFLLFLCCFCVRISGILLPFFEAKVLLFACSTSFFQGSIFLDISDLYKSISGSH